MTKYNRKTSNNCRCIFGIISFGPLYSMSGYALRILYIVETLIKRGSIILLEFHNADEKIRITVERKIRDIYLIKISVGYKNEIFEKIDSSIANILSFRPFSYIWLLFRMVITIHVYIKYLQKTTCVFIESSLFLPIAVILKIMGKKIIIDTHALGSLIAQQLYNIYVSMIRKIFYTFIEKLIYTISDTIIVVSQSEYEYLKQSNMNKKAVVVPHLINKSYITIRTDCNRLKSTNHYKIITFVGDMTSIQNRIAFEYIVRELLKNIVSKFNNVVFILIGRVDFDNIRIIRELSARERNNVILTGRVSDELLDFYLFCSDILISPLKVGGGTITKIYDYLRACKPMIITPISLAGHKIEKLKPLIGKVIYIAKISEFREKLEELIDKDNIHIDPDLCKKVYQEILENNIEIFNNRISYIIRDKCSCI